MKRLIFITLLTGLVTMLQAAPISRDQALRRAQQFLTLKGKSQMLIAAESGLSKARQLDGRTSDYYYVFNIGNDNGFVIVSGDDQAPAVLGYTESGSFDVSKIPANMEAWLAGYAAQIQYVQKTNNYRSAKRTSHTAVAPFITSHWDQRSPYSDACSFSLAGGTIQAVTGCVATAMAQVMYYYKYPTQTSAEIPAYNVNYTGMGTHTFESVPAGTTIDWDMIDKYTGGAGTDAQRAAVANLMSYAGKSVRMTYSNLGSTAQNADVADALKTYFGYGPTTAYKQKWAYSADEWDNIIYNEISSKRPVIYGGSTPKGDGHSFILDGCDADGYYHVNWGWGDLPNSPDGYFLLSAMEPAVEGVGGAEGGYNDSQEAVVGIQVGGSLSETPKLATTELTFDGGTATKTISRSSSVRISYQVTSHLVNAYNMELQVGLFKDGALNTVIGPTTYTISSFSPNGYLTSPISYNCSLGSSLSVGKYQIKVVSRQGGASTWLANDRSDEFFITAIVNENDVKLVFGDTDEEPQAPEVSDEDRTALKNVLAELADVANTKKSAIDKNASDMADLEAKIQAAENDLTQIDKQLEAIEKKLKDSEIADTTKQSLNTMLALIKDSRKSYYNALYDLTESYAATKKAHSSLVKNYNSIVTIINKVYEDVASVSTKSAYNSLKEQLVEVQASLSNLNPATIASDIETEYAAFAKLPTASNIIDTLTELDKQIDAAIKAAEEAKAEEEKQQQEAKRDLLKEEVSKKADALTVQLDATLTKLAEGKQLVSQLKDNVSTIDALIKALSDQAAALKTVLEMQNGQSTTRSQGLTDEQRQAYQAKLDDIEKTTIPDLVVQREALVAEIDILEAVISESEQAVDALKLLAVEVKAAVAEATTIEAAQTQEKALEEIQANANQLDEGLTKIAADITAQQSQISAILSAAQTAVKEAEAVVKDAQDTWTSIGNLLIDEDEIEGRYDLNGQRVDSTYKGVQIVRMKNGQIRKFNIK